MPRKPKKELTTLKKVLDREASYARQGRPDTAMGEAGVNMAKRAEGQRQARRARARLERFRSSGLR